MHLLIKSYTLHLQRLLASGEATGIVGYPFHPDLHHDVPDKKAGIYRIFKAGSDSHTSIYVGQSSPVSLKSRLIQHRDRSSNNGSTLKKLLEESGACTDAVEFFRSECRFQFVVVDEVAAQEWGLETPQVARTFFEDFAVAILQPAFFRNGRRVRPGSTPAG